MGWWDGMLHSSSHVWPCKFTADGSSAEGRKGYSTRWLMAHIWEINKCKSKGENSFFRTSLSSLQRMSTRSWLPPMDRYLFTFCQFPLEDERRLIGRNLGMPTGQRCRQVLEGTILSHSSLRCLILIGQSRHPAVWYFLFAIIHGNDNLI